MRQGCGLVKQNPAADTCERRYATSSKFAQIEPRVMREKYLSSFICASASEFQTKTWQNPRHSGECFSNEQNIVPTLLLSFSLSFFPKLQVEIRLRSLEICLARRPISRQILYLNNASGRPNET